MAGHLVCFGDQACLVGKGLLSVEFYQQALRLESHKQRANISPAMLYLETGQTDKASAQPKPR
jgi:hypothetical protein